MNVREKLRAIKREAHIIVFARKRAHEHNILRDQAGAIHTPPTLAWVLSEISVFLQKDDHILGFGQKIK